MNQPAGLQSRFDFWLEQVKTADEYGLSGAQFCKQHDLNYSQLMKGNCSINKVTARGCNKVGYRCTLFEALDNPPKIQYLDDAYRALEGYENGPVTFKRKP